MPTCLPIRPARRRLDLFFVFVVALAAAFFLIEIVDPMPMDVEAALAVAAP